MSIYNNFFLNQYFLFLNSLSYQLSFKMLLMYNIHTICNRQVGALLFFLKNIIWYLSYLLQTVKYKNKM